MHQVSQLLLIATLLGISVVDVSTQNSKYIL